MRTRGPEPAPVNRRAGRVRERAERRTFLQKRRLAKHNRDKTAAHKREERRARRRRTPHPALFFSALAAVAVVGIVAVIAVQRADRNAVSSGIGPTPTAVPTPPATPQPLEMNARAVLAKVEPNVYVVESVGCAGLTTAMGVRIDDRTIVSSPFVGQRDWLIQVRSAGSSRFESAVSAGQTIDGLTLANLDEAAQGTIERAPAEEGRAAVIIGRPSIGEPVAPLVADVEDLNVTSFALNVGPSGASLLGAPVFNARAQLIGIVTQRTFNGVIATTSDALQPAAADAPCRPPPQAVSLQQGAFVGSAAVREVLTAQTLVSAWADEDWETARLLEPGSEQSDAAYAADWGGLQAGFVLPLTRQPIGDKALWTMALIAQMDTGAPDDRETRMFCLRWEIGTEPHEVEQVKHEPAPFARYRGFPPVRDLADYLRVACA